MGKRDHNFLKYLQKEIVRKYLRKKQEKIFMILIKLQF
jgi:hypothetical protein